MTFKAWATDTAERALSTLVQGLVIYVPLLMAGPIDLSAAKTMAAAILPAFFAVILNAVTAYVPKPRTWALDVFVRMLRTFLTSVLGVLAAGAMDIFSASAWQTVAIGGLFAVTSYAKGELAKRRPDTVTPASLVRVG